jgi:hypothetical protein
VCVRVVPRYVTSSTTQSGVPRPSIQYELLLLLLLFNQD